MGTRFLELRPKERVRYCRRFNEIWRWNMRPYVCVRLLHATADDLLQFIKSVRLASALSLMYIRRCLEPVLADCAMTVIGCAIVSCSRLG